MTKLFTPDVIKRIFLLAVILFLSFYGNSMAAGKMCKNLKKVNNLDELLYQIYVNLDRDCLFTMPPTKLEKAWGIKILSEEHLQPGQTMSKLRNNVDFKGKPYRTEADAFYIRASRRKNRTIMFHIYITEAYDKAHATLFPEGNFPRLIPEPTKTLIEFGCDPTPRLRSKDGKYRPPPEPPSPKNPGVYCGNCSYEWFNSNKTRMIHMMSGSTNAIGYILVIDKIQFEERR